MIWILYTSYSASETLPWPLQLVLALSEQYCFIKMLSSLPQHLPVPACISLSSLIFNLHIMRVSPSRKLSRKGSREWSVIIYSPIINVAKHRIMRPVIVHCTSVFGHMSYVFIASVLIVLVLSFRMCWKHLLVIKMLVYLEMKQERQDDQTCT